MKKQVAVIGLGRLGISLATTLYSLGHDVLALDKDEKNVQDIAPQVTRAVLADATNEAALRELGIGNFDIAIVTTSEIESSVLTVILLKKLGIGYIIARADNELHGSILQKIGADKVVYPEHEMGVMIAHVLTLGDVIDYIPLTAEYGAEYGVVRMMAPAYFIGETLPALGFGSKGKWEVVVLLIQRRKEIIVTPNDTETVKSGDALIVAGNWDKLDALFTQVQKTKTKQ